MPIVSLMTSGNFAGWAVSSRRVAYCSPTPISEAPCSRQPYGSMMHMMTLPRVGDGIAGIHVGHIHRNDVVADGIQIRRLEDIALFIHYAPIQGNKRDCWDADAFIAFDRQFDSTTPAGSEWS